MFVHCFYIGILFLYVEETYINAKGNPYYSFVILGLVTVPLIYEGIQLYHAGFADYFGDFGNWLDVMFLWGSIAMAIFHYLQGPYTYISKVMMYIVLLSAIRRTFNFLRIFSFLSHIVTMLSTVIFQLRIFMTFFFILCLLFSL